MINISSERAKKLLGSLPHFQQQSSSSMRKYPGHPDLWIGIEWDGVSVKNLSFSGSLADHEKVLIESMASLLIGKRIESMNHLGLRECEAFLRDRNSVFAIEGMTEKEEKEFKGLFAWVAHWPRPVIGESYRFPSEKGPFRKLSLVDKIREVKAFLRSPEILTLFENSVAPELVDLEDLTVYVEAPYRSQEERERFEQLHLLGVEAFQEESLNFIPET